jgi:hypothetical protein
MASTVAAAKTRRKRIGFMRGIVGARSRSRSADMHRLWTAFGRMTARIAAALPPLRRGERIASRLSGLSRHAAVLEMPTILAHPLH